MGGGSKAELGQSNSLQNIQITERLIQRRVALGSDILAAKLVSEFSDKGIKKGIVLAAIEVLKNRGVLKEYQMGKIFRRMK